MYKVAIKDAKGRTICTQEFRKLPNAFGFLKDHSKRTRVRGRSAVIESKMSDCNLHFASLPR